MGVGPIKDLTKLCIHTITTRPWPLEDAIRHYSAAGVAGVSPRSLPYAASAILPHARLP